MIEAIRKFLFGDVCRDPWIVMHEKDMDEMNKELSKPVEEEYFFSEEERKKIEAILKEAHKTGQAKAWIKRWGTWG